MLYLDEIFSIHLLVQMFPSAHLCPNSLRLEWLWVYKAAVPVVETWSKEILVPPSLFFVLSGRGEIEAEGRAIHLPTGQAFLAAPGLRRQWFAKGTQLLSVGFRAMWPDGSPLHSQGLNLSIHAAQISDLEKATRRLFRAVHGARKSVTYREASQAQNFSLTAWSQREAAFRIWFAVYVQTLVQLGIHPNDKPRAFDERIDELVRRLDAWPLVRPLNMSELTAGLHIGARRMEQLLAAQLGITPHSHLNRRKVETARRLLATSATPLKEIAHSLGLRHASHFTKWFHQHVGIAPSAYRAGAPAEAA